MFVLVNFECVHSFNRSKFGSIPPLGYEFCLVAYPTTFEPFDTWFVQQPIFYLIYIHSSQPYKIIYFMMFRKWKFVSRMFYTINLISESIRHNTDNEHCNIITIDIINKILFIPRYQKMKIFIIEKY